MYAAEPEGFHLPRDRFVLPFVHQVFLANRFIFVKLQISRLWRGSSKGQEERSLRRHCVPRGRVGWGRGGVWWTPLCLRTVQGCCVCGWARCRGWREIRCCRWQGWLRSQHPHMSVGSLFSPLALRVYIFMFIARDVHFRQQSPSSAVGDDGPPSVITAPTYTPRLTRPSHQLHTRPKVLPVEARQPHRPDF